MANEITVNQSLQIVHGGFRDPWKSGDVHVTQTNSGRAALSPTIATSDTTITVPSMTAYGWSRFTNLDDTNYVDVGPTVDAAIAPLIRLYPGESAVLRLVPGIDLRAQADTGAVVLDIVVHEN